MLPVLAKGQVLSALTHLKTPPEGGYPYIMSVRGAGYVWGMTIQSLAISDGHDTLQASEKLYGGTTEPADPCEAAWSPCEDGSRPLPAAS